MGCRSRGCIQLRTSTVTAGAPKWQIPKANSQPAPAAVLQTSKLTQYDWNEPFATIWRILLNLLI